MAISAALPTPVFDKYEQKTCRLVEIDSSMPTEYKQCNYTPKFACNCTLICKAVKSLKVNFKRSYVVRSLRTMNGGGERGRKEREMYS